MVGGVKDSAVDVRHELLNLDYVPPLSTTATRLVEVLRDPEVEIRTLADIIERDPPLTSRILGLANSAFFGQKTPITRIEVAMIRVLGLNMVKSLSLSIALAGSFSSKGCEHFRLRDYWLHALGTATLAVRVGQTLGQDKRPSIDMLYLAGLLHNLGSLVLVHLRPEQMNQVYAAVTARDPGDVSALERQLIGVDRWQAGEWLAFRWHLPDPVTHTLGYLNDLSYDGEHRPILEIIRAARAWTLAKDAGDSSPFLLSGVDAARVEAVIQDLDHHWDELLSLANTLT